jgi:hypothetical protein
MSRSAIERDEVRRVSRDWVSIDIDRHSSSYSNTERLPIFVTAANKSGKIYVRSPNSYRSPLYYLHPDRDTSTLVRLNELLCKS